MEKKLPVLFEHKEECTGCSACFSICPKKIIRMIEDYEGFLYPKIVDKQNCILCYQCIKICPTKIRI